MPMCYTTSPATPGLSSCSATPNTETNAISLKTASNGSALGLYAAYLIGRGAGLTAISGIVARIMRTTTATATTGGTGATPAPKDLGMQAATGVATTGITAADGAGRTNHVVFGCGAAGPGGWVAPNPDSVIMLRPNATVASVDMKVASGTASLNYEFSTEHAE